MKNANAQDKSAEELQTAVSVDDWLREQVLPIAHSVKDGSIVLLSSQEVREILKSHRELRESRRAQKKS